MLQANEEGFISQPHPAVLSTYVQVGQPPSSQSSCPVDHYATTHAQHHLHASDEADHLSHAQAGGGALQNGDFLNARLVLPQGVAQTFRDNDVILLSKEDPNVSTSPSDRSVCPAASTVPCHLCLMGAFVMGMQREDASGQLHALGKVEARQGEQILSVCFYLTDDSQAGNPVGMQR